MNAAYHWIQPYRESISCLHSDLSWHELGVIHFLFIYAISIFPETDRLYEKYASVNVCILFESCYIIRAFRYYYLTKSFLYSKKTKIVFLFDIIYITDLVAL